MSYKYDFDRKFKFKINDQEWQAYLITDEEMIEVDSQDGEHGTDNPAMVRPPEKCLFVKEDNVNKKIITHELLHIYVDTLCTESANLSLDQFEEVLAIFFQENLDIFIKKRNYLYKRYKKLEGA